MKKIISIILCLWILLSCSLPALAANDVPQEVLEATKSVVRILSRYARSSSTGSGFVIKNDGEEILIATNNHVVDGNPLSISVWMAENELVEAEIVFTTARKDLCVLRLKTEADMQPLILAAEAPRQGQAVYAVGYPGVGDVLSDSDAHTSEAATITDGIISAIRSFTIEAGADPVKLLQINAAINPGNSGGPLFNAKGEVIGVNTYKVNKESQGIFGAVDISELWTLLEQNQIEIPAEETVPETEVPEMAPVEGKPFPAGILAGCLAVAALAVIWLFVLRKKDRKQTGKPGKRAVTLQAHMEAYPQGLGVGGAVSLLLPAAIQLRNLHNDGKLHLQVCPENIRIGGEGAFLKEPSGQETGRFNNGFAAPEIYRGAGFGITSDVYSFAALLFYAATGRETANSLQREALEQDLALLNNADFANILRRAMASGTADRTQSMQELIYAIAVFNASVQAQKPMGVTITVPEKTEQPVALLEEKQQAPETEVIPSQSANWRENLHKKRRKVLPIAAVLALTLLATLLLWKPNSQNQEITMEAQQETTLPETNQETTPESIPETTESLSAEALAYAEAEKLLADGETAKAAIAFGKLAGYEDARDRAFDIWERVISRKTLFSRGVEVFAFREDGTVATREKFKGKDVASKRTDIVDFIGAYVLLSNGTILSTSSNQNAEKWDLSEWTDIVAAVSESRVYTTHVNRNGWKSSIDSYLIGLRCDGTVVAIGDNVDGQCDVSDWEDIMSIITVRYDLENVAPSIGATASTTGHYTVGLKQDGAVVVTGKLPKEWDLSGWTDIVSISADGEHMAGLKSDGTVVSTQYDVSDWNNIIDIDAGPHHVMGLRKDGTVAVVGNNRMYRHLSGVDEWNNIIQISASSRHTVGLASDGTVFVAGYNNDGRCNVSGWTNIVAIETSEYHTIGLKADGTAIFAGWEAGDYNAQSSFRDIKLPTSVSIPKPQPKTEETPGLPASMSMSVRNAEDNKGVYVVSVEKGKAAQRASIAAEDIITSLDDYPIANVTDLTRALRNFKAGDVAYVTLLREGIELEFAIIFDAKPE